MNERIFTELYKKAWGHFPCPTGEPELKKFAELIVRQCIYLVDNLPPRYKDYRNQIEDSFRTDCVEKIEQYFGV